MARSVDISGLETSLARLGQSNAELKRRRLIAERERKADQVNFLRTLGIAAGALTGGLGLIGAGGLGAALTGASLGGTAGGIAGTLSTGGSGADVLPSVVNLTAGLKDLFKKTPSSYKVTSRPVLSQVGEPTGDLAYFSQGVDSEGQPIGAPKQISAATIRKPVATKQYSTTSPSVKTAGELAKRRILEEAGGYPGLSSQQAEDLGRIDSIIADADTSLPQKRTLLNQIAPEKVTSIVEENGRKYKVVTINGNIIGKTPYNDVSEEKLAKSRDEGAKILSSFGLLTDTTRPEMVLISKTPSSRASGAMFGLTESDKEKLSDIDPNEMTPRAIRNKIYSVNPRAAIAQGFESVPGISSLPREKLDALENDPSFKDNLNKTTEDNIERGRKLAVNLVRGEIQKNVQATSPNTEERVSSLNRAAEIARDMGETDLAASYLEKRDKALGFIAKTNAAAIKEAEKKAGLDRVRKRRIMENIDNSRRSLGDMRRMGELYDPAILTKTRKAANWFNAFREGLGVPGISDISPKAVENIQKSDSFLQLVNQTFNDYRRNVTGAQASYREIEFLKKGLFDESLSPTQFESRFKEYVNTLQRHQRLYNKFIREGGEVALTGNPVLDATGNPIIDEETGQPIERTNLDDFLQSNGDDDASLRAGELYDYFISIGKSDDEARELSADQLNQEGYNF